MPSLGTFALEGRRWVITGQFKDDDTVAIAPFEALNLELASLWVPAPESETGEPPETG